MPSPPFPSTACAPARGDALELRGTCFTRAELRAIAFMYNHAFPGSAVSARAFRSSRVLIAELRKRVPQCDGDDRCMLTQPWIQRHASILAGIKAHAFRPDAPASWRSNRYEWLSNIDILQVMRQYEAKHRHAFSFLDVAPMDFASCHVSSTMCAFDAAAHLRRNKKTFGAVLNLDTSDKPGSHWVGLYGDLRPSSPKYGVAYFDSNGVPPPPEVVAFMERVAATRPRSHAGRAFPLLANRKRYQFRNSECGVFAMMFVILNIEYPEDPHSRVMAMIGDDADMNAMRPRLFVSA